MERLMRLLEQNPEAAFVGLMFLFALLVALLEVL